MEKRIGAALILVENPTSIKTLNHILSDYEHIILARQGLPLMEEGIRIISLIIKGSSDDMGGMAGRIGRLDGVKIKSLLTTYKESQNEIGKPSS